MKNKQHLINLAVWAVLLPLTAALAIWLSESQHKSPNLPGTQGQRDWMTEHLFDMTMDIATELRHEGFTETQIEQVEIAIHRQINAISVLGVAEDYPD